MRKYPERDAEHVCRHRLESALQTSLHGLSRCPIMRTGFNYWSGYNVLAVQPRWVSYEAHPSKKSSSRRLMTTVRSSRTPTL